MELPKNPTNAQLLDQTASIGLSAMEYILKLHSAEQKSELTSHINSVTKGLQLLNKEWDPQVAELVQDNLNTLKEDSTNPSFSNAIKSTLLQNWEYGNAAYSLLEEKENLIVDANKQVTSIYDQWSVLKRSEQSEAFTELLDKTSQNKIQIIANANDRAVGRISDDLKTLQTHLDAANIAKKVDYDEQRDGIQGDLNAMNAGYVKKIATALGFEEVSTEDNMVTYQLPPMQYIQESGYKEASEWLNKFETYKSTRDLASFEKQLKHEETRVFDFVSQLGHSSDPGERAAFGIIVDGLLGDDEDVSAQLNALSEENPELAEKATEYLSELQDLFPTGKYETDFNALKDQAETLSSPDKGFFANLTDAQQAIVTDQSNEVVADIKTLDQTIGILNDLDEYKDMQLPHIAAEVEDLMKIPGRADNLKRSHVHILTSLIAQDDTGWSIFNEDVIEAASTYTAAGKMHPIKEFSSASNIRNQYKALNKLVKRYIGSDGTRLRLDEVNELFGELRAYDPEQVNVFYNLLQSFKSLDTLSPLTKANVQTIGDF